AACVLSSCEQQHQNKPRVTKLLRPQALSGQTPLASRAVPCTPPAQRPLGHAARQSQLPTRYAARRLTFSLRLTVTYYGRYGREGCRTVECRPDRRHQEHHTASSSALL